MHAGVDGIGEGLGERGAAPPLDRRHRPGDRPLPPNCCTSSVRRGAAREAVAPGPMTETRTWLRVELSTPSPARPAPRGSHLTRRRDRDEDDLQQGARAQEALPASGRWLREDVAHRLERLRGRARRACRSRPGRQTCRRSCPAKFEIRPQVSWRRNASGAATPQSRARVCGAQRDARTKPMCRLGTPCGRVFEQVGHRRVARAQGVHPRRDRIGVVDDEQHVQLAIEGPLERLGDRPLRSTGAVAAHARRQRAGARGRRRAHGHGDDGHQRRAPCTPPPRPLPSKSRTTRYARNAATSHRARPTGLAFAATVGLVLQRAPRVLALRRVTQTI